MATDMGKSHETNNIIRLTNWRRNAKRKSSKESMTDPYVIVNSVSEWLNIIEMKKLSTMGCSCRWRSQLSLVSKRLLLLQEQMVAPFGEYTSLSLLERCFKHALVVKTQACPFSKVFQACACGEDTSLLVVEYTSLSLLEGVSSMRLWWTHKPVQNSVIEWLKVIETKNFVNVGMLLRTKITLTIWPHKNTSTIRANGGFIQMRKVLILCHWGIDLISSKHCLPCNDWNKIQKETHKYRLALTEINSGHRVLLLHGGIGKVLGGLLILVKVTMEMRQVLTERGDLLNAVFGKILLDKTFMNSIIFGKDGLFTADSGLL